MAKYMIGIEDKPTPTLRMHDWVMIKKYSTTSRVLDIKYIDETFQYGVTDRLDDIHYFKADELVKLVEER